MVEDITNEDEAGGRSAMQLKSVKGDQELPKVPRGWIIALMVIGAWVLLIGALRGAWSILAPLVI